MKKKTYKPMDTGLRHQMETSALLEASRAILKHREFKETARSIFDSCKNLIGATGGYVAMTSKDVTGVDLLFLDTGGRACTVDRSLPMPIRGLRGEAYRTGKAVYHNDFANSEYVKYVPEGHVTLDNILFTPLVIEDDMVGLLGLANKSGGFTENDAHLASAFGELVAIALLNSRTLETLKHSEERFRFLTQSASDAIICSDMQGNIVFWNQAAETMFGYSADEMLGKSVSLLMPERLREAYEKGMKRVVSTGELSIIGRTVESVGLRKEGTEFPIELSLSTWQTKEGPFFTAIIRDITQRKLADEKYETIISTALDGFWITDMQGHFLDVNDAYCHLIGYSREELLKMGVQDVEAMEKPEETAQHIQKVIEIGYDRFETQHRSKDGRIVDIEANVNFMPSKGGRFCVFLRDITERKLAEEVLRKAHDELEIRVQERTAELVKVNETLKADITERKRAEEALRQSQQQYTSLVRSIDGIVWEADAQTFQFSFVSEHAKRMLGYPVERWITEPTFWKDHIHPDDREWAVSFCVTATAEMSPHQFEYRMIAADGRTVWLRDIVTVAVENDRPSRLYGVIVDITEHKCAEEEIQRENDTRTALYTLLRLSLEDVPLDELLTKALDLSLSIPWLAFESSGAILLAEDDQVLVLKIQRGLAEPIQRACARVPFGRCLCGRAAAEQKIMFADCLDVRHEITYEGIRPHGHYCVPILSAGKTLGVIDVYLREGHLRDIQEEKFLLAIADTLAGSIERKRAEEVLRESEASLANAQRIAHIGNWDWNIQTNELRWSDEIYRIFGLATQEFGATYEVFLNSVHPADVEFVKQSVDAALNERKPFSIDHCIILPDGTERVVHEQAEVTFDAAGKPIRIVGTVHDITEHKREEEKSKKLEEQLHHAQKMEAIGTLAGGIAHDFNNILSAIIGYTELSLDTVLEGSQLHSDLTKIFKAGYRARDLVNQILTFSRQREQEKRSIMIAPIIKETLKMLRASLPSTIEIRQNIETDLGTVLADPTQIHQVIMNLCTNAGHAMSEKGGILEVSLTGKELDSEFCFRHPGLVPGPYLKLMVSDTGHGIPPEILPRIFEPYFTTRGKSGGTGLGLAVVHGIVTGCGGAVTVYSESGKGTTFKVYLPVTTEEPVAEVEKTKPVSKGRERILLIDDEQDIVDVGKRILEQLGYTVTIQTSSIEALELFQKDPYQFDLVISDMTMPFMTGDELAEEFMRIRQDIPVIICTGYSERITEEEALNKGIRAYLGKPLLKSEMAETVRRVLEQQSEDI